MNNKKGFTLIELLVVVLILGILAAMAMPQYFKAVERSRMSEAVSLLGSIAQAQQRKYLQINKYTSKFSGLDVAPKGASEGTFCTKGAPSAGSCGANGNGFKIEISGSDYEAGKAVATRVSPNTLQYNYTLERYYANNATTCTGDDANGAALCADFCGIDELASSGSCCSSGATGACTAPTASGFAG
ncbi:type IV pilin protein [Candidatus Avelusimicrobium fimicolum]|uniref:type IV pilin protein n=1 Tax=Candidatus Avelusimicrobium fimicolum TaxID=3416216 RepID=UPI003D0FAEDC